MEINSARLMEFISRSTHAQHFFEIFGSGAFPAHSFFVVHEKAPKFDFALLNLHALCLARASAIALIGKIRDDNISTT